MSPSLNSTNLELVGHFEKKQQQKRREGYVTPKRDIRKIRAPYPDVVAYEFYECFSSQ